MIEVQEKKSMAIMTSFRIGGEALFYVEVKSVDELKEALRFAKEKNIEYYILGGGTNLLVADKGYDGLIIRIKMGELSVEGNILTAESGVPLIKVINFAAQAGLSGIESLAGIPGTFGGAVRGNAGAFGMEIGRCVQSVVAMDSETLELKTFQKDECKFSYRSSFFKQNKNLIVISANLELQIEDKETCERKVKELITGRMSKGLHGAPSAGSYFMNPKVENKDILEEFEKEKGEPARNGVIPAGWIIEQAGLKGKKIGGAQVSEQHANYIINTGDAKADDVMMLVSFVKQQVRDQLGVQLQEEVNYLGF